MSEVDLACRVKDCVARAAPGSAYCDIHEKYALADSESRCAKCVKKIKTGTYAIKRSDGRLEHQTCARQRPHE